MAIDNFEMIIRAVDQASAAIQSIENSINNLRKLASNPIIIPIEVRIDNQALAGIKTIQDAITQLQKPITIPTPTIPKPNMTWGSEISKQISDAIGGGSGGGAKAGLDIGAAWGPLAGIMSGVKNAMTGVTGTSAIIQSTFSVIGGTISTVTMAFTGLVTVLGALGSVISTVFSIASSIIGGFVSMVQTGFSTAVTIVSTFVELIQGGFNMAMNAASSIIGGIVGAFGLFGDAISGSISFVQGFLNIMSDVTTIVSGAIYIVQNAADVFLYFGQSAYDAFSKAVVAAEGFESGMSKVRSVMNTTDVEWKKIRQTVIDVAVNTSLTAAEAAQAMYKLGSAGMSAADSATALAGTVLLAQATQSDLDQATTAVVGTLSQFGLQATEAGRVSNVFTAGIQGSMLEMNNLAEAMKYAGFTGGSFGRSVEEVVATLGTLANAGLTGSMAGTAYRQLMSDMANPTKKAKDALDAYGFSMDEINPRMHSMADIIDRVGQAALKDADYFTIFGTRGGPVMMSLVQQGGDAIRQLEAQITGTGAAADMSKTQLDNLAGAMMYLQGSYEALQIVIGDVVQKGFAAQIMWMQALLDKITMFVIDTNVAVKAEEMFTLASQQLATIITEAFTPVRDASTTMAQLGRTLSETMNMLGTFTAEVLKHGAAFAEAVIKSREWTAVQAQNFQMIGPLVQGFGQFLAVLLQTITTMTTSNAIQAAFASGIQGIIQVVLVAAQALATLMTTMAQVVQSFVNSPAAVQLFVTVLASIGAAVTAAVTTIMQLGVAFAQFSVSMVSSQPVMTAFTLGFTALQTAIGGINTVLQTIITSFSGFVVSMTSVGTAQEVFKTTLVDLAAAFTATINSVTTFATTFVTMLAQSDAARASFDIIVASVKLVAETMTQTTVKVTEFFTNLTGNEAIVNAFGEGIKGVVNLIAGLSEAMAAGALKVALFAAELSKSETFTGIIDTMGNMGSAIAGVIGSITNFVMTLVSGTIQSQGFKDAVTAISAAFDYAVKSIPTVVQNITLFFNALTGGKPIGEAFGAILLQLATLFSNLVGFSIEAAANITKFAAELAQSGEIQKLVSAIFDSFGTTIGKVIGYISEMLQLYTDTTSISESLTKAWELFVGVCAAVAKGFSTIVDIGITVVDTIRRVFETIQQYTSVDQGGISINIGKIFEDLLVQLEGMMGSGFGDKLAGALSGLLPILSAAIEGVFKGLSAAAPDWINYLLQALITATDGMTMGWSESFKQHITSTFGVFREQIMTAIQSGNWAEAFTVWGSMLLTAATTAWTIISPQIVEVFNNLWPKALALLKDVGKYVEPLAAACITWITEALIKIALFITGGALVAALLPAWGTALLAVVAAIFAIKWVSDKLGGWFESVFKTGIGQISWSAMGLKIVQGVGDIFMGIVNGVASVYESFTAFGKTVWEDFQRAMRPRLDEMGKWVLDKMKGIWDGVKNIASNIVKDVTDTAKALVGMKTAAPVPTYNTPAEKAARAAAKQEAKDAAAAAENAPITQRGSVTSSAFGATYTDQSSMVAQGGYNTGKAYSEEMGTGIAAGVPAIENGMKSVTEITEGFSPPAAGPLKGMGVWGYNVGTAYAAGMASGIKSGVPAIENGMKGVVEITEGHSATLAGPLKSISAWGYNVGSAYDSGISSGIRSSKQKVADSISNMSTVFTGAAPTAAAGVKQAAAVAQTTQKVSEKAGAKANVKANSHAGRTLVVETPVVDVKAINAAKSIYPVANVLSAAVQVAVNKGFKTPEKKLAAAAEAAGKAIANKFKEAAKAGTTNFDLDFTRLAPMLREALNRAGVKDWEWMEDGSSIASSLMSGVTKTLGTSKPDLLAALTDAFSGMIAHSPPKTGPLSTIDKSGKSIGLLFAKNVGNGILDSVSTIESGVEELGSTLNTTQQLKEFAGAGASWAASAADKLGSSDEIFKALGQLYKNGFAGTGGEDISAKSGDVANAYLDGLLSNLKNKTPEIQKAVDAVKAMFASPSAFANAGSGTAASAGKQVVNTSTAGNFDKPLTLAEFETWKAVQQKKVGEENVARLRGSGTGGMAIGSSSSMGWGTASSMGINKPVEMIRRLAGGGIVKEPTLAMVGDNAVYDEAVIPLTPAFLKLIDAGTRKKEEEVPAYLRQVETADLRKKQEEYEAKHGKFIRVLNAPPPPMRGMGGSQIGTPRPAGGGMRINSGYGQVAPTGAGVGMGLKASMTGQFDGLAMGSAIGKSFVRGISTGMMGQQSLLDGALYESIGSRMIGHSPPPKGVLSQIDTGGKNVGEAWAQGVQQGVTGGVSGVDKAMKDYELALRSGNKMAIDSTYAYLKSAQKQATQLPAVDPLLMQLAKPVSKGESAGTFEKQQAGYTQAYQYKMNQNQVNPTQVTPPKTTVNMGGVVIKNDMDLTRVTTKLTNAVAKGLRNESRTRNR